MYTGILFKVKCPKSQMIDRLSEGGTHKNSQNLCELWGRALTWNTTLCNNFSVIFGTLCHCSNGPSYIGKLESLNRSFPSVPMTLSKHLYGAFSGLIHRQYYYRYMSLWTYDYKEFGATFLHLDSCEKVLA